MSTYIQVGVTALRDPVTGAILRSVPMYAKAEDLGVKDEEEAMQPMLREAAREIQALPPVVIFLIKAAGLALLAALAFILLRALSRRVARTDSPAGTDTRESLDDEAPRPRAAPLRRGPADGVRRQYRRALLLLRARGGRVSPTMNTLQIEQQNETLADPDALRALRAVYLPARYGDREASPEDARAAREAVERLKKNK